LVLGARAAAQLGQQTVQFLVLVPPRLLEGVAALVDLIMQLITQQIVVHQAVVVKTMDLIRLVLQVHLDKVILVVMGL